MDISQLQEDMRQEWWRAGEFDNFSLKQKMERVGCRPLKRRHLACVSAIEDQDKYAECKKIRQDLDECYKALNYLHLARKREEVERM
jgi:hypothetical protein